MRNFLKRPAVVITIVAASLGASGLAVAYWTATGTGTATAGASNGSGVTLAGTVPSGLAPGGSKTVTIKATPSGTESVYIGTVTLTSVTVDNTHQTAGCLASWFSMANVVAGETAPAGGAQYTLIATGTLAMSDTPAINQDACKGATLTLNLSV